VTKQPASPLQANAPKAAQQGNPASASSGSSEAVQSTDAAAPIHMTFPQIGTFRAMTLAEEWLEANGYTVGSCQRGSPRGIMPAGYAVMKWRNLSPAERDQLSGRMTGDMRNGPVIIEITRPLAVADVSGTPQDSAVSK
jgi:hypothetical protein